VPRPAKIACPPTHHWASLNLEVFPKTVRFLATLIGKEAAMELVRLRGGITLYMPSLRNASHHWLEAYIGQEAVAILAHHYNGEVIEIPRCEKSLRILREHQILAEAKAGTSNAKLARKYGYTGRGIRKLLRRAERTLTPTTTPSPFDRTRRHDPQRD
jgi:DNA-binding CsgD family transcriptional regulator